MSTYQEGEKVNLVIERETDLGFVARINDKDEGLLYHNEIFEALRPGQRLAGYIKKLREDGRIDLQLQPFGNQGSEQIAVRIIECLEDHNGFLALNDKTAPEKIYELFGVSKKKYKMALGTLYKNRIIAIEKDGIRLNTGALDLKSQFVRKSELIFEKEHAKKPR